MIENEKINSHMHAHIIQPSVHTFIHFVNNESAVILPFYFPNIVERNAICNSMHNLYMQTQSASNGMYHLDMQTQSASNSMHHLDM